MKVTQQLSKTVFPHRFFVIVRCWDQVGNLKNSNWGKPSYVAAQPHPKEDMFFFCISAMLQPHGMSMGVQNEFSPNFTSNVRPCVF